MFGRKKDGKDLQSKGFVKVLNKIFRFVFFPFIHPLIFVFLLFLLVGVLFAWPLYNGVKLADIPNWYVEKSSVYYAEIKNVFVSATSKPQKFDVKKMTENINSGPINVKKVEKKPGKDEIVVYETQQMINRKAFEMAQEIPVDVKKTFEHAKQAEEEKNDLFSFRRNDALGLTYLENPIMLEGVAKVVSANEVKVGQRVLLLYGIYTHPASDGGKAAVDFMKQNIEGENISCKIVAYTNSAIPTGLCVFNGFSLNQKLVDLGYSNDITLN